MIVDFKMRKRHSGPRRSFSSRAIGLGLTLAMLFTTVTSTSAQYPSSADPQSDGARDFDFQRGEWRVHHRVKRPGQTGWTEFDGTCRNRALIDGSANVEEHTFVRPAGNTYGIALRTYDPKPVDGRSGGSTAVIPTAASIRR